MPKSKALPQMRYMIFPNRGRRLKPIRERLVPGGFGRSERVVVHFRILFWRLPFICSVNLIKIKLHDMATTGQGQSNLVAFIAGAKAQQAA
jgi:hypothetical protein